MKLRQEEEDYSIHAQNPELTAHDKISEPVKDMRFHEITIRNNMRFKAHIYVLVRTSISRFDPVWLRNYLSKEDLPEEYLQLSQSCKYLFRETQICSMFIFVKLLIFLLTKLLLFNHYTD